jgi:error-prone DNA polymerase
MRFAELLGRSCFSFLDGASHPEELIRRARALDLEAIALCDRDGLYGSARMHAAATEHGQKVIVGAELSLNRQPGSRYADHPYPAICLLVRDRQGYSQLCQLLTEAHGCHDKGEAGIDIASVARRAEGLLLLVPLDPRCPVFPRELATLREAFGQHAAIAVWRHLDAFDAPRLTAARAASRSHDLPIVASGRPRFHQRARKPLADVMQCIRLGTTLSEAGTALRPNAEAILRSAAGMHKLFTHEPRWIERSVELAAGCSFSLSQLRYQFPYAYSGRDENGGQHTSPSPDEALRQAVQLGGLQRYPQGVPTSVRATLDRELSLIEELDMAPYFLSVKDIVDMARERQILCQGRGSAANSAVCYVLGITAVDPAKSAMLFERFMSPERKEPPDIDVDFEHERREEVIQAIYARYGRDRAAMVSEVITYRQKSALRATAKVFGLAADQCDRLTGIAHHSGPRGPRDAHATRAALSARGLDPDDATLGRVLELSAELEGMPRHLSVHVGGFVLSAEPLHHVAPIEPARMPGRTVIPWDKDDLDALGFFKIDILGLGMLTAIRKALRMIHDEASGPFDPIAALAQIPAEDTRVYDAICKADTIGVFQIESRAQMAMLPILKPRAFYDLVVEVGIVRPGPIQGKMVHPYLRRRTGEEAVSYPHACLQPILERTLGVPLFQEQVMQIAIVGAGYSPGEADQLRRDMAAWRKHGRLEQHRERLYNGFRARGISQAFSERLFLQIMGFGEYGFPESHAASFALLVYASSWLKVYHPAAFACALLNSQPMGFYAPGSLVRDAQKHDVEVRAIDVLASEYDCILVPGMLDSEEGSTRLAMRLGLRQVRGLSRAGCETMLAARDEHGFADLHDFMSRSGLKRNEIEALAEVGALACFVSSRREALWQIRAPREPGLLAGHAIESPSAIGLPRLERAEQLTLDYACQGFSLDDHPMRHLRKRLANRRVRRANEQANWSRGQQVTVAGVVLCRQRPMTASGVVFITLEDETGVVNLVLYSRVYQRYELAARHAGLLLARGRVDRRGEVVHVQVRYLERLAGPLDAGPSDAEPLDAGPSDAEGGAVQPLHIRSRDFF